MVRNWLKKESPDAASVATLTDELQISSLLAGLLIQRGITHFDAAKNFFRPSLENLYDPFLMKDMDKAVERLTQAVHQKEKVLVYGDYDVDGTTAVTLVYSFLQKHEVSCDYYIPDRYTEGYGFSFLAVEYAAANDFQLIITLDCGVRDVEKVSRAKELGIDVIICDHHNPDVLPDAVAVLDPKRTDCAYPFKGLSGCGVGFKLLQAFSLQHGLPEEDLFSYLDLLTISIGADIVPLEDENRVLAYHGLQLLAGDRRPGVAAMLDLAGFKKKELTITDVVFLLAPRINAAGRIFSGKQAVALLLENDHSVARTLATKLEENNTSRRSLDKEITREALAQVRADSFYLDSFSTVVESASWHKGVVGIVASRMVEAFHKPAIVLVSRDDKMSGSARSIEGVDLFEVLTECSGLLEQFGGHTMAAGLSLRPENFIAFRQKFDQVVAKNLDFIKPVPTLKYDAEIHFSEITEQFYRILKQFSPFGPGNMSPVFLVRNVTNAKFTRTVGDSKTHLKLHVRQKRSFDLEMDGIGFDLGHWAEAFESGEEMDLLFSIEENEWNGRVTLQLNVKDIRISDEAYESETTQSIKNKV